PLPDFLERVNRDAAKALKSAGEVPVPTIPNLPEPTEEILQRTRTDIGRLLDQAQDTRQRSSVEEKHGPQLYVFVSFSMPEITLKRLLSQAARIDASLILRGLVDDDLGKTKDKIAGLMEADAQGRTRIKGGFAIDPTLFERFDISQVPSFVLTDAPVTRCTESDCASADHVRLAGDITIDYALETISREAPAMKASAEQLLARMKEGTSP
ncbi:MAG TPA: type-F conjugative transfer system pilin assembly protein TrbC, partial [Nitrospira sp.]|nr:type-F conjugative transfer system pilin assembly protein TrbC [Nitrospira sp.]